MGSYCSLILKVSCTPNLPDGTGVWVGYRGQTSSAGHRARAAMEGVTMGMNYGLNRLRKLGLHPTQIRATGGGAKSKVWRQIMADIFNAEVVTLKVAEGAAYGAALQALWSWRRQQGEEVSIESITDRFVKIATRETAHPIEENVKIYQELQALQDKSAGALKGVFAQHENLLQSEMGRRNRGSFMNVSSGLSF